MKKSRLLALLLALVMIISALTACGPAVTPDPDDEPPALVLEYAEGTVLRMATGYNSKQTGITFHADIAKDGITLADGNTYNTGDLKPTWVEVQNVLKVVFEDKYQGNNATAEWNHWSEKLGEVDMVSGTASQLSEAGVAGKVVNIFAYHRIQ